MRREVKRKTGGYRCREEGREGRRKVERQGGRWVKREGEGREGGKKVSRDRGRRAEREEGR